MARTIDRSEYGPVALVAHLRARDLVGRAVMLAGRPAGKVTLVVRSSDRNPIALLRRGLLRRHWELVNLREAVIVHGVIHAADDARRASWPTLEVLDSEDVA